MWELVRTALWKAIALQPDNRIVLVGQFTQANGVTRYRITRLMPNGRDGSNNQLRPLVPTGISQAVLVQPTDGMLVVGGSFSQFQRSGA